METTFDTEGQDSVIVAAMLGSRSVRGNRGAKTREPMPDLIYGQFIEHLGRSIYGASGPRCSKTESSIPLSVRPGATGFTFLRPGRL